VVSRKRLRRQSWDDRKWTAPIGPRRVSNPQLVLRGRLGLTNIGTIFDKRFSLPATASSHTGRVKLALLGTDSAQLYLDNISWSTASAPIVLGDYNGSGLVDTADYVMWRKYNINGQQGYRDWRANFGKAVVATGASASELSTVIQPPRFATAEQSISNFDDEPVVAALLFRAGFQPEFDDQTLLHHAAEKAPLARSAFAEQQIELLAALFGSGDFAKQHGDAIGLAIATADDHEPVDDDEFLDVFELAFELIGQVP
jgi:hypothetical protein